MKFISWNVNGLRACVKPKTDDEGNVTSKGFESYFKDLDADFFCLQETKMQEGQLDLQFEGYRSYWNYADKKGYSGTAIYARHEPLSVKYGIGIDEHDHEGRVITLEYDKFFLVTVYTPNSQDAEVKGGKPRRLPVAHNEIDLKNPKTNRNNAGFTDEEREKMTQLLNNGFIDTFRKLHPEEVTYSWWSYRFRSREKNAGWRIDYFLASERLLPAITSASIHTEVYGSDHCPVEVNIDL